MSKARALREKSMSRTWPGMCAVFRKRSVVNKTQEPFDDSDLNAIGSRGAIDRQFLTWCRCSVSPWAHHRAKNSSFWSVLPKSTSRCQALSRRRQSIISTYGRQARSSKCPMCLKIILGGVRQQCRILSGGSLHGHQLWHCYSEAPWSQRRGFVIARC